jgi:hypothetical protein
MATLRRKNGQGGQEIVEFGLVAMLLVPLLIGSIVTGIGLVRSIQAQHVCRDLTSIYIHGGDFSTYPMQQLAERLSRGLNLQVGSSFTGTQVANTGNSGDGLVTVSQIMYVGSTTSNSCIAVGSVNCSNHDSFVFTQRVSFGNSSVSGWNGSSLGDPTTTAVSAIGAILDPITDTGAKLPGTGQTNMTNLWQVSGNGRAPLQDGQVVYVVELYIQAPGMNLGSFSVGGTYARYFY